MKAAPMHILFIADPLSGFKIHKETTYAMMRAAQARGHTVWSCTSRDVFSKAGIFANAQQITLRDDATQAHWFDTIEHNTKQLNTFDAIVMRRDPPFDVNYVTDTWLLDAAVREGAVVFNAPSAIRNHSEKVSILEFPELTAPTLIASDKALLSIQRDNLIKLHRLLSKLKLSYSKTSQYFTTENGDIEKNRTNYLANRETVHEAMVMAAIYFPKFTDDLNEIYLQTDFAWNAQEEIIKKSTNPTSYPALGSAIEIIEKTINTIQNKISNTAQELEG